MSEKERYAPIGIWVKVFRKEGSFVSITSIRNRLREAGVIGETGRTAFGQLLYERFFAESDVRKACCDLLRNIPQADEDGLIRLEGKVYGTIESFSRMMSTSSCRIGKMIKKHSLQGVKGKNPSGRPSNYYNEQDVRHVCSDILEDLPQADDDGLILFEERRYRTIAGLSQLLGISGNIIERRIKKRSPQSIRGKCNTGRVYHYYSEAEVRQVCSDMLAIIPRADKNGFFEEGGQSYGTAQSLGRLLGVAPGTIKSRLRRSALSPIKAKDFTGHLHLFYSERDIRELFADLIAKKSKKQ